MLSIFLVPNFLFFTFVPFLITVFYASLELGGAAEASLKLQPVASLNKHRRQTEGIPGPDVSDYPPDEVIYATMGSIGRDQTVMFTEIGDSFPAKWFAHLTGKKIYTHLFPQDPEPFTQMLGRSLKWYQDFADRYSRIFCEQSSGTVYLVSNWPHGPVSNCSVWARIEFPVLKLNPAVTEIILVDKANYTNQRVYWPDPDEDPGRGRRRRPPQRPSPVGGVTGLGLGLILPAIGTVPAIGALAPGLLPLLKPNVKPKASTLTTSTRPTSTANPLPPAPPRQKSLGESEIDMKDSQGFVVENSNAYTLAGDESNPTDELDELDDSILFDEYDPNESEPTIEEQAVQFDSDLSEPIAYNDEILNTTPPLPKRQLPAREPAKCFDWAGTGDDPAVIKKAVPPPPAQSRQSGPNIANAWATVSVTQYQKPPQGNGNYRLSIRILNAKNAQIGARLDVDAPPGQWIKTTSKLPYGLYVAAGSRDADPLRFKNGEFAQGNNEWDSNDRSDDHRCTVGDWRAGKREVSCRFSY